MLRDHGFKPYSGPGGNREAYGFSIWTGDYNQLAKDVAAGNLGSRGTGDPVLDAQILDELRRQLAEINTATGGGILPSIAGNPDPDQNGIPGGADPSPLLPKKSPPTVKQPKPSLPSTPKPPSAVRFPSRGDVEKDLGKGAVRENNDGSRSVIWGKHDGDAEAARRDFERFAEGYTVNEYPNGTKSFKLPDGSNVTLRGSTDSRPTISIEKRGEPTQKFRYGQPEGKP